MSRRPTRALAGGLALLVLGCGSQPKPSPPPATTTTVRVPATTRPPPPPPPPPVAETGVAFVEVPTRIPLSRTYDQRVEVLVENRGDAAVAVTGRVVPPGPASLQLGLVGPGAGVPLPLAPGETRALLLVIHAPEGRPGPHAATLELREVGDAGRVVARAELAFEVAAPPMTLGLDLGPPHPVTLARTLTIENRGEWIGDLDLRFEGDLTGRAAAEPRVETTQLKEHATLEVDLVPLLVPGTRRIEGVVVLSSGTGEERLEVVFEADPGQRVYLGRGGSVATSRSATRQCTNKRRVDASLGGPHQPGPGPGRSAGGGDESGGGAEVEFGPEIAWTGSGYEGGVALARYPEAARAKNRDPFTPPPGGRAGPTPNAPPRGPPGPTPRSGEETGSGDPDLVTPNAPPRGPPGPTPGPWGNAPEGDADAVVPNAPPRGPPGPTPGAWSGEDDDDSDLVPPNAPPRGPPGPTPGPWGGTDPDVSTLDLGLPSTRGRLLRAPLALGNETGATRVPGRDGMVAAAGPGGTDLTWGARDPRGLPAIAYSRVAPDRRRVRAPVHLNAPGEAATDPALASAGDAITAAWREPSRGIVIRRSADGGASFGAPVPLSLPFEEAGAPGVARSSDAEVVAWKVPGPDPELRVATRTSAEPMTLRALPALPGSLAPDVALSDSGTPYVLDRGPTASRLHVLGAEKESSRDLPPGARLRGSAAAGTWLATREGTRFRIEPAAGGAARELALPAGTPAIARWELGLAPDAPWIRLETADGQNLALGDELLRLPSASAGTTDALLAFELEPQWSPQAYRQHSLTVTLNGHPVLELTDAVPQGRFLVPVPRHLLRWDHAGRGDNRVVVHTRELSGGNYYQVSRFALHQRAPVRERYVVATSQAEADARVAAQEGVNHGRPDLALGVRPGYAFPALAPETGGMEVALQVMNRGDARSAPARLRVRADGTDIATVDVPALDPFRLHDLPVRVAPPPDTGVLEFELEAPGDDEDDALRLDFVRSPKADPARQVAAPRRLDRLPPATDVTRGASYPVALAAPGARHVFRLAGAPPGGLDVALDGVPRELEPVVALLDAAGKRLEPDRATGRWPDPGGALLVTLQELRPEVSHPDGFTITFTWKEAE